MQREESDLPGRKTSALTNTDVYSFLTHNQNDKHVIFLISNKMQTFLGLQDPDELTDHNLQLIATLGYESILN